jgi:plastocyanin
MGRVVFWFALLMLSESRGIAKPQTHKVVIKSMIFAGQGLSVATGDTVQWVNEDIVPHTITGKGFDSGPIAPNGTWEKKFESPGTVPYKCSFHPSMTASVTVK